MEKNLSVLCFFFETKIIFVFFTYHLHLFCIFFKIHLNAMTTDGKITKKNRMLLNPCNSMRETEQQLKSLTKENFNLKLRIYFLEMRSGLSSNPVLEKDSKDYAELLMKNESLKNDLDEKQDLIKQAAMAIDILEQNQKVKDLENVNEQNIQLKTIEHKNKTIAYLNIVINSLKNATNFNRDDIVTKMGSEMKECNAYFSDHISSFMEDDIKMKVSTQTNSELNQKCLMMQSIISDNEKLLSEQALLMKVLNVRNIYLLTSCALIITALLIYNDYRR